MSVDAEGDFIDAPEAPTYDEPDEETRERARAAGMSPDIPEWSRWPIWSKIRFLRRLRTQGDDRPEQYIDNTLEWFLWALFGGRGSGKSLEANSFAAEEGLRLPKIRTALVARTFGDVRDTIFEGETGLLAMIPDSELRGGTRERAYNRSLGELFLANHSKFKGFSSEKPSQLRGPQHHRAILDEASSWQDAESGNEVDTTISNLFLGLRLKTPDGSGVRVVSSTTPKPNALTEFIHDTAEAKGYVRVLSTYSNLKNLDEAIADVVIGMYEGTDVAAQELEGKILSSAKGAAWTDDMIQAAKEAKLLMDGITKVVIGVDPAVSTESTSDETGLIAVSRTVFDTVDVSGQPTTMRQLRVEEDRSGKITVADFPNAVCSFAEDVEADEVVVEINNGMDFVVQAITSWVETQEGGVTRRARKGQGTKTKTRQIIEYIIELPSGHSFTLRPVWQSADKLTRAKAASVWWTRGEASHAPGLQKVEKQMVSYEGGTKKSPDRLDALTSAVAALSEGQVRRSSGGASPTTMSASPPPGRVTHPLLIATSGEVNTIESVLNSRIR